MLNDFWKKLKSGTDIRGVATAVEGMEVNLTEDVLVSITNGFALWLSKRNGRSLSDMVISVGRDSRITGPYILKLTTETLCGMGAKVLNCGLASTPAMFMTTVDLNCDGAVQITASHHPFYRNGLKFFTPKGGLEGSDIEKILEYASAGQKPEQHTGGYIEETDYMSIYAERLRDMIKKEVKAEDYKKPLSGFKIVVDAGNGVGGFYATEVLEKLGADITGSQFLEPDGMFPNHVPNPEDSEAMKSICRAVKENHADLGVIFDTDVDRGGAVDSCGNEINRNRLVALAAAIALENHPGGLVVTDSVTSSGLNTFIEDTLGGHHLRFKRGYKNVIDEAIRQNKAGADCPLAIETSGHAAMRENYFLDDGAYLCTKIIIKAAQLRREGETLESLIESLKQPAESREIRIDILDKDFRSYGEEVIENLKKYSDQQPNFHIAPDNYEGLRVYFDKDNGDGWFLLRLSVHDPIMPLNIESDTDGGIDMILSQLMPFLTACPGLGNLPK